MKFSVIAILAALSFVTTAKADISWLCKDAQSPYYVTFGTLSGQKVAYLSQAATPEASQLLATLTCTRARSPLPPGENDVPYISEVCESAADLNRPAYTIEARTGGFITRMDVTVLSEGKTLAKLPCSFASWPQ